MTRPSLLALLQPRFAGAALVLASALCAHPHLAIARPEALDDSGRSVTLVAPATRVVSLAPHVTAMLAAIGADDALVGLIAADPSRDAPHGRVANVGTHAGISIEAVLALRPDLVIAWETGNPPAQIERLRKLLPAVFVSQPRTVADIASSMERFGVLLGREHTARQAADQLRARAHALQPSPGPDRPVRVFVEISRIPLLTVSERHLISDGIRLCGGTNVFGASSQLTPAPALESVLAADPDVIVTSAIVPREDPGDYWRTFAFLAAVRNGRVHAIAPEVLHAHDARFLDAMQALCAQLDSRRDRDEQRDRRTQR